MKPTAPGSNVLGGEVDQHAAGSAPVPSDPPMAEDRPDIEELLARMRHGDREAAAEFILRYGSRVRRRIRGKLGVAMRRLFDSQEIMSTLGRRLDQYVLNGKLRADGEDQLWSLIFKMANNALIDKMRVMRRLERIEGSDSHFARDLLRRIEHAEQTGHSGGEIEIDQALRTLPDAVDRQILSRWLLGESHNDIAHAVGIAPTAVRKRWQKIKEHLRERFNAQAA